MSRHTDKSPAYQWYPKDYQSDFYVIAMSLEQEGAYRRLLDACWLEHGLPKDHEQLWRLAKCRSRQHFDRLWPGIKPKFYERDGRLHNRRLDRERRKQVEHRKKRQHAARVRWDQAKDAHAVQVQPGGDAMQCFPSSSPSSSADCSQKSTAPRARRGSHSTPGARLRARLIRQQIRKALKEREWSNPQDLVTEIVARCERAHIAYDLPAIMRAIEDERRWQEQQVPS